MARKKQSPCPSPAQTIELVLGGGGIKGFGHIGLLRAIAEKKVNIGKITGVSIGSAVAAFYANGYTPDQIKEIFLIEMRRLGPDSPDRSVRVRNLLKGGLDMKEFWSEIVQKYKLQPRRNLRILAFNVVKADPVVFEGTRYDLATALAASCSVPGVMRPVWYGQKGLIETISTVIRSWRGKTDEGILVDGGVHHPNPGDLCAGRAIIGKLGVASRLPSEWLSVTDTIFHLAEMAAWRLIEWMYPDPDSHVVIRVGMPNVACLTFGLSRKKCLEMVAYGYGQASRVLEREIRDRRVPVKP